VEVAKNGVTDGDAKTTIRYLHASSLKKISKEVREKKFHESLFFSNLFFIGLLSSAAAGLNIST